MKKWRIVYWLCLYRTEWIVRADSKEEARRKFKEKMGDHEIIQISEAAMTDHN